MFEPKLLQVKDLGLRPYSDVWQQMKSFTEGRSDSDADELWLVQHPPVFTQGQAGKPEHLLHPGEIPVIQTDRGGQVTFHGPGQLVVYPLLDLRRLDMGVRALVNALELSVIELLAEWQVEACAKPDAPGVYVDGKKIASLGLRVRRGCSFHGLAVNVDMNLEPFLRINPCGYNGLQMTQLADWVSEPVDPHAVGLRLVPHIARNLGLTHSLPADGLAGEEQAREMYER